MGKILAVAVPIPDGITTTDAVTGISGGTSPYLQDYVSNRSVYSNAQVTGSGYLTVDSGTTLNNLNFQIITVTSNGTTSTTSSIVKQGVKLAGTWQRFAITGITGSVLKRLRLLVSGSSFPVGQTIYMWGAEMVMGFSAGAPVETTSTATNVSTGASAYLAANGLNETFKYDAFGNLQQSGNYSFVQGDTTSNQLSGWTYRCEPQSLE